MKTRKRKLNYHLGILVLLLLVFISIGCSQDEDNDLFIKINTLNSNIPDVNNCNSGNGIGSGISLKALYTSSPGLTINKIHIKSTWSNGDTDSDVDLTFQDDGDSIDFGQCVRYEQQGWIEFEIRLEANGTVSNPATIKVNKPSGGQ